MFSRRTGLLFWRRTGLLLAALYLMPGAQALELTVGVEELDHYPIYRGRGVDYEGFARDLLEDFARKHGHSFQFKVYPILRLHDELLRRQTIDLKFPDNPNWQAEMRRDMDIRYSRPVLDVTEGFFVLPANLGKRKPRMEVGIIRGFTPPVMDEVTRKSITFRDLDSFEVLVRMVEAGRVDAVFANKQIMTHHLATVRKSPQLIVLDPSLPVNKPGYSLSSIKYPEVVAEFDSYLGKEKAAIQKLMARYGIAK